MHGSSQSSAHETVLASTTLAERAGAAGRTFESILDEHRIILWLALAYVLLGGVALLVLERPWPLQITNRILALTFLPVAFVWLVSQRMSRPAGMTAALATHAGGAVLVLALAVPVQITFQSLKQSIGPVAGFQWDPWLSSADRLLHGGPAWRWFSPIVRSGSAIATFDVLYRLWFAALLGFLLWACWSKQRALRSRAIVAFLLLWIAGGTIGAWTFASAGPCYYQHVAGSDAAYGELLGTLRSHGSLWATFSQDTLWTWYRDNEWHALGGISAFPSMHVGFAVLLALVAWSAHRGAGVAFWIFAGLTQVGSVVLAWHYAIDGYAGAAIAWGCWRLARTIHEREIVRPQGFDSGPILGPSLRAGPDGSQEGPMTGRYRILWLGDAVVFAGLVYVIGLMIWG